MHNYHFSQYCSSSCYFLSGVTVDVITLLLLFLPKVIKFSYSYYIVSTIIITSLSTLFVEIKTRLAESLLTVRPLWWPYLTKERRLTDPHLDRCKWPATSSLQKTLLARKCHNLRINQKHVRVSLTCVRTAASVGLDLYSIVNPMKQKPLLPPNQISLGFTVK